MNGGGAAAPQARTRSKPRGFPRLARVYRRVRHAYATIDPRAAGVYRLVLGFLLVADGLRHWAAIGFLYSNDGVLTNDFHLWQPSSGYMWSIFHAFSTRSEVHVLFAATIVCHLLLMAGYRSRLFAFLSFIAVTSRDARLTLVENGGYVVVNLMCLYAILLPIGARFSIDAFLSSWRRRRETSVSELNDRAPIRGTTEQYVSIVALILTLNLALVYFGNVVQKSGNLWRAGTAVHYVLHLDRMVTGLAVFCREHLPDFLIRIADWSTLTVEATIFAMIMSPFRMRFTRPTAAVLMFFLHTTFGVMMRLGPFSWFMIGWSTILWRKVSFEDAGAFLRRRAPPIVVALAPGSRVALRLGSLLCRADVLERVRFVPAEEPTRLLSVRGEDDAAWITAPRDVTRTIARALPFGAALHPLLAAVTFGAPARVFAWLQQNEARVDRFFDLAHPPPAARPPSPLRERVGRLQIVGRELFAIYMGLGFTSQALLESRAIPKARKWEQPKIFAIPINTFRTYQGWGMFAANPIQEDGILVIDAYTIDGRRVDPYNGGVPDLDLTDSRGLGIDQLHQDYGNRIRLDGNTHYREQLKEYLFKYHLRTGNPADELVAFDVYWLRDKCPKPGNTRPFDNDAVPLATWRKQGFVPPPGSPPIPLPPKIRSAEKWADDTAKTETAKSEPAKPAGDPSKQ